jgi:PKD repeat protein
MKLRFAIAGFACMAVLGLAVAVGPVNQSSASHSASLSVNSNLTSNLNSETVRKDNLIRKTSQPAKAPSTPPGGTLSLANPTLTYTGNGPYFIPSTQGNTCSPPDQCDEYALTVDLPADFATTNPNDRIHIEVSWIDPSGGVVDYDVYVLNSQGTNISGSSAAGSSNPEQYDIPAFSGTKSFTIRTKPFVPAGTNYSGKITLVSNNAPPPPPPPPPPSGSAPRYYNYAPPQAIGENSGEPSIGYNPVSKRAMYIAGLQTLQITFPEDIEPKRSVPECCNASWADVSYIVTRTRSLDPILFTDQNTGRTFVSQLNSISQTSATGVLVGLNSLMAFTDDDGANWTPAQINPPDGSYDHQTVGGGPYPASVPLGNAVNKGDAVYYCGQAGVTAFCSRSDDGGLNFGRAMPIYTAVTGPTGTGCGGIHGHVKVAPDGTVYVPNYSCNGKQGVAVSTDAGTTWTVRTVPGSLKAIGILDPSVAISKDPPVSPATSNTMYLAYTGPAPGGVAGDNHIFGAVTKDRGLTWSTPVDVGASLGINNAVFASAVAGDSNRAAVAFLGTTTSGDHQAATFKGTWYGFVAHTYDGGQTWTTVNATPKGPVQREACIWNGGGNNPCRNLLDFNDATIDDKGRVLFAFADGCIDGCETGGPNSYSSKASVARQSGGRGVFQAFDTPEPVVPQRACLSGRRDDMASYLRWVAPDNGGSAITSYKIYRGTAPGNDVQISEQTGSKTTYNDRSVDVSVAKYTYKIVAHNDQGDGPASNAVELPVTPRVENTGACTLPGVQVISDPTGDETDTLPQHDITSVSIAEPDSLAGKLVVTIKVANLSTIPPGWRWSLRFGVPGYDPPASALLGAQEDWFVSMITSDDSTPTFTYGTTGVAQGLARFFTTIGSLDPASNVQSDGTITLVLSKSAIQSHAVCASACGPLNPGQAINLTLASVRFSPPSVAPGAGGTNETIPDTTGGTSYVLRPANLCLPNTPPLAVLTANVSEGIAPLTVAFDGSGSSDPDAIDTIASYTFNFGDGGDDVNQTSPTISHTFDQAGEYIVRLVVTDSRGKVSSNTAQYVIEAEAEPTPTPTPTPTPPPPPTCIEDNDSRIAYSGGWHLINSASASEGHFRYHSGNSTKHFASLDFSVPSGRTGSITYSFAKSPKGGTADIYLDGVLKQTVNYAGSIGSTQAPEFKPEYNVQYGSLSAGAHKLEIKNMNGVVYLDRLCLESSSSNAQPLSGPGNTSNQSGSASAGQTSSSNYQLPAGAQEISVSAEASLNVPFKVVLVDPSGLTLQTADAVAGIATISSPVTQGGVYVIKVVNLSLGPLQFTATTTPTVQR